MKALQQKSTPAAGKSGTKKGTRANGSDFSSARGSEERHVSTAAQSGRGPRRNRDYDLETVSVDFHICFAEVSTFHVVVDPG
jgi:mortality factor 4-like protein 1